MSKIAKKPVLIKPGINISLDNKEIKISGPKGELVYKIPAGILVKQEEGKLVVAQTKENDKETRPLFGLTRSIIANMIDGVSEGFEKKLELSGVGYRAQASGDTLTLSVGYSHPVIIKGESGITFNVAENVITVLGANKDLVGNTAAKVRAIRPPEPYKGKGIKYVGERIRRKAGKAAKAVGGAK